MPESFCVVTLSRDGFPRRPPFDEELVELLGRVSIAWVFAVQADDGNWLDGHLDNPEIIGLRQQKVYRG
jgi:hypothetical protein